MQFIVTSYTAQNGTTPFVEAFMTFQVVSVKLADKVTVALEIIEDSQYHHMDLCEPIGQGLFMLRVRQSKHFARVFFVKDEEATILLLNGFYKTTNRIPAPELKRARALQTEIKGGR